MALIAPFRALRYDPAKAGDINQIVTQPYDKIGPDLQSDYYNRSPYNVVRVIKSNETNSNSESTYPQAGADFHNWIEQGILQTDLTPAVYLYYQTFTFRGKSYTRKGFVASVKLEEDKVHAHENTLAGPKADRLRLLRAIECSDELIFMLFSDAQNEVIKVMDSAILSKDPLIQVKDDFGETHRVWAVTDSAIIDNLKIRVAEQELYIADGHHRYETAITYMNECEAKGWKSNGVQGFDHRMMALFPMEDPGLVIFPTHRLVKNVEDFNGDELLTALKNNFVITPYKTAEELLQKLESDGTQQIFGMRALGTSEPYYALKLKDLAIMDLEGPEGLSEASRQLGVTILHTLILEQELGIDKAKLSAGTHVDYGRSAEKALERVGQSGIQAAFLLNPTTVSDVKSVAEAGERMPQKSTDFYPKLLAGLMMMKLDIQK